MIVCYLFPAFDQALEFHKSRTIPANWKTELKEDSSSSEAEEEEEEEDDEKEKEDKYLGPPTYRRNMAP